MREAGGHLAERRQFFLLHHEASTSRERAAKALQTGSASCGHSAIMRRNSPDEKRTTRAGPSARPVAMAGAPVSIEISPVNWPAVDHQHHFFGAHPLGHANTAFENDVEGPIGIALVED